MEVLDEDSFPQSGIILAEAQWGPETTHLPVLSQMKHLYGMCFPVFFCLLALFVFKHKLKGKEVPFQFVNPQTPYDGCPEEIQVVTGGGRGEKEKEKKIQMKVVMEWLILLQLRYLFGRWRNPRDLQGVNEKTVKIHLRSGFSVHLH